MSAVDYDGLLKVDLMLRVCKSENQPSLACNLLNRSELTELMRVGSFALERLFVSSGCDGHITPNSTQKALITGIKFGKVTKEMIEPEIKAIELKLLSFRFEILVARESDCYEYITPKCYDFLTNYYYQDIV